MDEVKNENEKIRSSIILYKGVLSEGDFVNWLLHWHHIIPKSDSPEKWVEMEKTWKGNKLYIELKWKT